MSKCLQTVCCIYFAWFIIYSYVIRALRVIIVVSMGNMISQQFQGLTHRLLVWLGKVGKRNHLSSMSSDDWLPDGKGSVTDLYGVGFRDVSRTTPRCNKCNLVAVDTRLQ